MKWKYALGVTPEWKLFINFCPNSAFHPRFTFRGRIWRKSAVAKLPKSRLVLLIKKTRVRDTFLPPPISPTLSLSRPKFREHCRPLTWVYVYRLWSGSAAVCRTYSGKCPKTAKQYRLSAYNNITFRLVFSDGNRCLWCAVTLS